MWGLHRRSRLWVDRRSPMISIHEKSATSNVNIEQRRRKCATGKIIFLFFLPLYSAEVIRFAALRVPQILSSNKVLSNKRFIIMEINWISVVSLYYLSVYYELSEYLILMIFFLGTFSPYTKLLRPPIMSLWHVGVMFFGHLLLNKDQSLPVNWTTFNCNRQSSYYTGDSLSLQLGGKPDRGIWKLFLRIARLSKDCQIWGRFPLIIYEALPKPETNALFELVEMCTLPTQMQEDFVDEGLVDRDDFLPGLFIAGVLGPLDQGHSGLELATSEILVHG